MAGEYTLNVILSATDRASGVISGFLKSLGPVGGAAVIGGAALIGLGAASTKMAGDFQAGMTRLYTTAGETKSNLQMVGDGILGMSVSVGTGAQTLANAMYYVESAGFHGQAGLDVMRIAAMGAKTENSDLTGVTKALVSTLNAYAGTGLTASTAMNTLIAATSQGHMTLNDLAGGISNVLPVAAKYKVSLVDTTGAIAEMTKQGDDAATASTHLRQMMIALEAPSKIGAAALKSVGLSTQQVSDEMKKSLPGALKMITDAVGKKFPEGSAAYNEAIKNIAGGSKQMMGFLELTGNHMSDFQGIVDKMTQSVHAGGNSIMGWADVQQNFNFKVDQAKAAIEVGLIQTGMVLLPILSLLGYMANKAGAAIGSFAHWLSGSSPGAIALKIALVALAGAMLGLAASAVPALLVMAGAWLAEAAAATIAAIATLAALWPFLLIGAVIALVVVGIILAIQHWGAIAHWIQGVWAAVIGWLVGAWQSLVGFATGVFNAVKNAIVSAFNATISWIVGAWRSAVGFIVGVWSTLRGAAVSAFNAIASGIRSVVQGVISWLVNAWHTCVNAIVAAFEWLYAHNYYFKALVDTIRNVTQAVISWLVNAWHNCVNFIVSAWSTLAGLASAAWNAVKSAIMSVVGPVIAWLNAQWHAQAATLDSIWQTLSGIASSVWNAITSVIQGAVQSASSIITSVWSSIAAFLSGVWSQITSRVQAAWATIVAAFNSARGTIMGILSGLGASISGFFSGLAGQAFSWGANIIRGIVNGITSMIGAVANAASNVASTITHFLGFHSPTKEGPGQYADEWAPNLMKMYANGIVGGAPALAQAAANAVMLMSAGFKGDALQLNSMLNKQGSSTMGMFANKSGMMGDDYYGGIKPGGTQLGTIHNTSITITANDAADVAAKVKAIQDKQYRMSGTHSVVSSGGKR